MKSTSFFSFKRILSKAVLEEPLSRTEVLYLLGLEQDEEIAKLFEVARELRRRYFGDKIFLYGFIYFSTWCRNNCTFCYYRSSNKLCRRYRKTESQIIEATFDLAESGVHLLDLTMGEDPLYYSNEDGFAPLLNMVNKIKRETYLPIMISFGVVPDEVLKKLREAGADWYACYQETHNRELFRRLRPNQDYDVRLNIKYKALKLGFLIEEGLLTGVRESLADIAGSIEAMKNMGSHQVRVMNFVPQKGTPMSNFAPPNRKRELVVIAVLRLLLSHRLIPASLDVCGIDGLKERLEAGANVVTSLIPFRSELRGVAQSTLDITEGYRTIKGITPILNELRLTRAGPDDYIFFIDGEKKRDISQYYFDKGCVI